MSAEVAAAVIRRADARILIAERFRPCPGGGRWEFPGGTREEGETLEECLHRELEEELDIQVKIDGPLVTIERPYSGRDFSLHAFLCTHTGGEPKAIGCAEWRWVELGEMRDVNLTGADRKILEALERKLRVGDGANERMGE